MASITREKATKSGQLTVTTKQLQLPSHEGSLETRRGSNVSTPSATASNGFDTDIEAMMPVKSSEHLNKTSTMGTRRKSDCQVWPGQEHWQQKAKAARINNRSCQCIARMSKRNRIIAKILIGLLIVGIAVGIGVGISKPLGAGIWQPQNH
ncbi:hypothetical protein F4811DRAFT_406387 [Daldinia bambusicola]|nr:hypothetical protein F4811DRAFT_406387 [Daldinia bambusicola]